MTSRKVRVRCQDGNTAVDFCWEQECYDSSYTEANEIFLELIGCT